MKKLIPCRWQQDENGAYDTGCGNTFELINGTPAENKMRYCPYCGRALKLVRQG